jgi:SAM-dependent methyltransferase
MEWGQGRYEEIADQLLPGAQVLVEQAAPSEGDRVIDLGCGTGNAALLAAERGATVIGVDPAQRLLDVAAEEAAMRGLDATFVIGEAASIPVTDSSADIVMSVFGVVFAPDPQAAAEEITRVVAPDGRILFSAWVPEGAISRAVRFTRQMVSEIQGTPPAVPPFPWHEREALDGLFEPHGFGVSLSEHSLSFTDASAQAFLERGERYHPLAMSARPIVEEAGRADELRDGLLRLHEEANEDPEAFRVTSRYVVAEIRRR